MPVSAVFLGRLEVQPEQGRGEGPDRVSDASASRSRSAAPPSTATTSRRSTRMLDFKVWEEVEPPKGTVYNYPMRPWHKTQAWIAASPAPPEIAVQIYNRGTMPTMVAKLQSGQSIKRRDRLGAGRAGRVRSLSDRRDRGGARPAPAKGGCDGRRRDHCTVVFASDSRRATRGSLRRWFGRNAPRSGS